MKKIEGIFKEFQKILKISINFWKNFEHFLGILEDNEDFNMLYGISKKFQ